MAKRTWTSQDDTFIIELVTREGLTAATTRKLREHFQVNRHQLRGHLNQLGLTAYGRRQLANKRTTVDPTNERIMELERQVLTLSSQRKDLAAQLRVLQAQGSVKDALIAEMTDVVKPLEPLPRKPYVPAGPDCVEEDLVMHLSDEHGDQVVMSHRVLGLEDYNFRVCMARAERYVKGTLDFTLKTLRNYRFPVLWLLCYGDHSSGEIHEAVNHSHYRNIFRNCLAIGQLHGLMIRDLAAHFEKVNVICVSGNHGRRKPKKEYVGGAWNNWDYLVHETAHLMLADHKNVEFRIPDAFSTLVNIRGWNFHVSHGDDIKMWNSIPYYGIERATRRLSTLHALNDQKIHYFVMGHFHQLSTGQHPGGETVINGSFKYTDEFALHALGGGNPPMQLIHGVHEKYGMTWRLPVYLRSPDKVEEPERYAIKLAAE